jgi:hypothetical protein
MWRTALFALLYITHVHGIVDHFFYLIGTRTNPTRTVVSVWATPDAGLASAWAIAWNHNCSNGVGNIVDLECTDATTAVSPPSTTFPWSSNVYAYDERGISHAGGASVDLHVGQVGMFNVTSMRWCDSSFKVESMQPCPDETAFFLGEYQLSPGCQDVNDLSFTFLTKTASHCSLREVNVTGECSVTTNMECVVNADCPSGEICDGGAPALCPVYSAALGLRREESSAVFTTTTVLDGGGAFRECEVTPNGRYTCASRSFDHDNVCATATSNATCPSLAVCHRKLNGRMWSHYPISCDDLARACSC